MEVIQTEVVSCYSKVRCAQFDLLLTNRVQKLPCTLFLRKMRQNVNAREEEKSGWGPGKSKRLKPAIKDLQIHTPIC